MSNRHRPASRPGDLDPLNEPERWEGLVRRIGERAADHLARRREPSGVLELAARWARPALSAAAALLLLAGAGTLALEERGSSAAGGEVPLARAVVPSAFAGWITGTAEPSVTELVADLETLNGSER